MKLFLLSTALFITCFSFAQQDSSKKEMTDAIQKFSFLPGKWKGGGWFQMNQQKDSLTVDQTAEFIENGMALRINAAFEFRNNGYKTTTSIVITYDPKLHKYHMSAETDSGQKNEGDAWLSGDHILGYLLQVTNTQRMRYTFSVMNDKLIIAGETSYDNGSTWLPSFGATLTK